MEPGLPGVADNRSDNEINTASVRANRLSLYNLRMSESKKVRLTETVKAAG
jgi:hypothetical protein